MTDNDQKRIFAKNLNYYISLNGKQQNEVAKDLNINASTLNMWCKGNSFPGMGKIQVLADYFKVGKSDLIDDKLYSDPVMDARILSDTEIMDMIKKFYCLSVKDREAIQQIIESLYSKEKSGD
ncbi:MAG: helix-turn-helix transcriptional regulator [Clostridium sp.]|nr:helix-turn-helix transcriptional regulator [Clostridium sp.]